MSQLVAQWGVLQWALAASLLVGLLALLLAVSALKQLRQQKRDSDKLVQRLIREVTASSNGTLGMGQRLMAMEKRLQQASIDSSSAQPTAAHSFVKAAPSYEEDEDFKSYAEAAQLFRLGVGVDEVARRCGLSRAEASLLEVMQKSGAA